MLETVSSSWEVLHKLSFLFQMLYFAKSLGSILLLKNRLLSQHLYVIMTGETSLGSGLFHLNLEYAKGHSLSCTYALSSPPAGQDALLAAKRFSTVWFIGCLPLSGLGISEEISW